MKGKHEIQRTYGRGRIRLTCSCGKAQTRWMPASLPASAHRQILINCHRSGGELR